MSGKPNAPATPEQLVQLGLTHHQAGRLDQANDAYQQALNLNPSHPDALHLLGMLAHQVGDNALALDLIQLAIHEAPKIANYQCNLGTVWQAQGDLKQAIHWFQQALSLDDKNPIYHYNLGRALQAQGSLADAASSYRRALLFAPSHVETLSNLGHTLGMMGELEEAIECFKRAINAAPSLAEMHFNLGVALNQQGKLEAASESYQTAIGLAPGYAQALCNLGATQLALGRYDDAIANYQRAITLQPALVEAHYNLGIAYQAQDQLALAIASYQQALALQPTFVEGLCNLGNVYREQGRLDAAIDCYQRALTIKPDYANAYSNLLFLHAYHATLSPEAQLTLARGWETACIPEALRQQAQTKRFKRAALQGRRLRVGYVSGDFRKHATSYFIEQLFAQHDRDHIELFAYSNNRSRDGVTERIEALVDHWVPIAGLSDQQVCEHIAVDGIDILIDLAGHSANNRLGVFARRAAPIQATYLYFATTGLSTMDHWIGDPQLAPPTYDTQFSEHVWRLPRTWLAYRTIDEAPPPQWRPAEDGTVWLGCFNHLGKLTPPTLRLWAKILHALPQAKLLLKNKDLADTGNQQRILSDLQHLGIPASRIELQANSPWETYMVTHDRLDIALDPIGGHGGGTSTCDALWMGVPVIHLSGDHVGARFATSILHALGQPDWIATSEDAYIAKTIALANDVNLRRQLRATQRQRMAASPLCDARDLAHHLEQAYVTMFEQWLASQ